MARLPVLSGKVKLVSRPTPPRNSWWLIIQDKTLRCWWFYDDKVKITHEVIWSRSREGNNMKYHSLHDVSAIFYPRIIKSTQLCDLQQSLQKDSLFSLWMSVISQRDISPHLCSCTIYRVSHIAPGFCNLRQVLLSQFKYFGPNSITLYSHKRVNFLIFKTTSLLSTSCWHIGKTRENSN